MSSILADSKISSLLSEIDTIQQDAQTEVDNRWASIRDYANSKCGTFQLANGVATPATMDENKSDDEDTPTVARKSSKSTKKGTAKKTGRSASVASGGMALKPAILKIVGTRSMWKEHLGDDLPRGATGLTVGEIRTIIHATGLWSSKSKTADNQIYTACSALDSKEGGLKRDKKTRRYELR